MKYLTILSLLLCSCAVPVKRSDVKQAVDLVSECAEKAINDFVPPITHDKIVQVLVYCAEEYTELDAGK